MATNISRPSSLTHTDYKDLEPDRAWKDKLRAKIEKSMTPIVNDAEAQYHKALSDPKLTNENREAFAQEYARNLDGLREIAQETYVLELNREYQERRWAAGLGMAPKWHEVLTQEQKDIMYEIEGMNRQGTITDTPNAVEPAPREDDVAGQELARKRRELSSRALERLQRITSSGVEIVGEEMVQEEGARSYRGQLLLHDHPDGSRNEISGDDATVDPDVDPDVDVDNNDICLRPLRELATDLHINNRPRLSPLSNGLVARSGLTDEILPASSISASINPHVSDQVTRNAEAGETLSTTSSTPSPVSPALPTPHPPASQPSPIFANGIERDSAEHFSKHSVSGRAPNTGLAHFPSSNDKNARDGEQRLAREGEESLARREKEMERREREVKRKEEDINRREEDIGRREDEIGEREDEVGKREDELGHREDEIGRREDEVRRKEFEAIQREATISANAEAFERREEDLKIREQALNTKTAALELLTTKTRSLVIRSILMDAGRHRLLIKCGKGDAQILLDGFQLLLDNGGFPDRGKLVVAMQRLSERTELYPLCYVLDEPMHHISDAMASGRFADIYKVSFQGETTCLKVIRAQQPLAQRMARIYAREAIVWCQLTHPNILPFYGLIFVRSRIAFVAPWAEMGNLSEYLAREPRANRVLLCSDTASGMQYLHTNNVVHGDMKSLNVLVDASGRACLGDFGLSGINDKDIVKWTTQSSLESKGGTARWQAPELHDPEADVSVRNTKETDIYAWASTCYEIFTGNPPFFETLRETAVAFMILRGNLPTRPHSEDPTWTERGLTKTMWQLFEDCWAKEASKRPTISKVILRLEAEKPAEDPRPPGQWGSEFAMRFRNAQAASVPDKRPSLEDLDSILSRIVEEAWLEERNDSNTE